MSRPIRLYLVHAGLLTFSLAVWGLFFNLAILAFGHPRSLIGTLNSVAAAVAALFSLPLWWLAIRIGLRNALLLHAVAQLLMVLASALWPTVWVLVVMVALAGATTVFLQVAAQPYLMHFSPPEQRDRVFAIHAAVLIGVGGLGNLLAGALPSWFGAWLQVPAESAMAYQGTFGLAAVGLALAIIPLLFAPDERRFRPVLQAPSTVPSDPHPALRDRLANAVKHIRRWLIHPPIPYGLALRLLSPPLLIGCGAALLIPYLNLFFKEQFQVSDGLLGVIFAAAGITTGLASLAAPRLAQRMGRMPAVVMVQVASLPFLLLLGFAPWLWVAVSAALLRAALYNMGWPLYDAYALEQVDESLRPMMVGLIGGASSIGHVLLPPVSIWVQEQYGFTPLVLITTVCYSVAAACLYWFFVRPGPKVDPQQRPGYTSLR